MARTLYRIYLYLVATVMLGFAAFSLGSLLNTLLRFTGLRGAFESAPSGQEVVQNTVLAAIALVVSLGLGGFHYWLIRRDIAQDPGAGRGAVRSLFLNLAQAVAALVALYAGANVFLQLWRPESSGASGALAATLVAAGVFALEQSERSRSLPAPGAPLVLQRLHTYGVLTVYLLSALLGYVNGAVDASVRFIFGNSAQGSGLCPNSGGPFPLPPCNAAGLLAGQWLAALWVVAAWGVYFWLARGDIRSVMRVVAQLFGFVAGLVSAIVGVEQAAEVLFRFTLGVSGSFASEVTTGRDFFAPLLTGLLALALYGLWLLGEAPQSQLGEQGTTLTVLTLSAIALGVPFYVAIVQLLHGVGESAVAGTPYAHDALAASLGLLVSGLAHPLIAFELRRRTTPEVPIGPRRGFVLAGLAVGALAGAIGGAIALYLTVTAQLGSPVSSNWPVNARTGAEVFLVGAFVAGMHLWRTLAEQKLLPRPAPPASAPADQPGSIEAVLDDLLAGRLTRDQAAARIRALR